MIPKAHIIEWTQNAPWKTNEQVEQDLVICRALVDIFSDDLLKEELAFRGGTALHKLFLTPQPRYSEDIDLVQVNEGPIGPILDKVREVLDPWFEKRAKYKKTVRSNKLTYRFESEFPPVQNMRLKIEINTREHFTELGFLKVPFEVESKWFSGKCEIKTYYLEELMGSKLRALYQRSKGRDLYDQYKALLKVSELDIKKVIQCYHKYMEFSEGEPPDKEQYIKNIQTKMEDSEFFGDTVGLIRQDEDWDAKKAFEKVKEQVFDNLFN